MELSLIWALAVPYLCHLNAVAELVTPGVYKLFEFFLRSLNGICPIKHKYIILRTYSNAIWVRLRHNYSNS